MKNMVLPGRFFTHHQYPNRKIGLLGLAKASGTNVISYVIRQPAMAAKALVGMAEVEDRFPQHPRFRGEEFAWYEERCTGCASCAKYCPLGIIRIVTHPSGQDTLEGDKYAIDVFDIDIGRCMFCGLCVEACPYDAIHMGSGFEQGTYRRSELVIDVDKLRKAPKRPSTWFRPQIEARQYRPQDGEQATWREVARHEKPTVEQQEKRWAKR
jgi:formate hydrogenlyase subunit 6/NADH:ubiquinone oxidoreductase subunit I